MPKHDLHRAVANAIENIINNLGGKKTGLEFKKDEAAGGKQHLSFFLSPNPQRESGVSKVDIMIVKNDKVKLVCEVEESGFIPTKIFGKVFSTAAAKTCRLFESGKHTVYDLDKNGVFIQVLSSEKILKKIIKQQNTKKFSQGNYIQSEIQSFLSQGSSWLKHYHLFFGDKEDFDKGGKYFIILENIINKLLFKIAYKSKI